jgi:hypothetical protein
MAFHLIPSSHEHYTGLERRQRIFSPRAGVSPVSSLCVDAHATGRFYSRFNMNEERRHKNYLGDAACIRTGRTRAEHMFPVTEPCEGCGNPKTERHHIDGNTLNNDRSNISFLCRKCHMKEDGRYATQLERSKLGTEAAIQRALARTHCSHGHELVLVGFYEKGNHKLCKRCTIDKAKRWYAAHRAKCDRQQRPY